MTSHPSSSSNLTLDFEDKSVDQHVIAEEDVPCCLRKDDGGSRPSGAEEILDTCATSVLHADGVHSGPASRSREPAPAFADAGLRGDVGTLEKTGLFDGVPSKLPRT
eukprot:1740159-Rhodomonas_salina.1